jgi:D-3-phosphoglycerate dehydrogenase
MGRENILRAVNLRFVGRLGSGLDIIDLPTAEEEGVAVINVPEGNANAVAEHAMGMLLCLMNRLVEADREVRKGEWNREARRGRELAGRTVGLLGYGYTGRAMAQKLKGFDVKINVFDKYKKQYAEGSRMVNECALEEVLADSDILSIHLPLTEETHGMVDSYFLSKCKEGVILINTSRGKICQTPDILSNLQSGQLGGVAMDVLEDEGAKDLSQSDVRIYNELFAEERTLFSPHIAGWTEESLFKIGDGIAMKILNFANIES